MADHFFVVLEGGDGAGKTSVRRYLFQVMRRRGVEVLSIIQTCWLDPAATKVITNARFFGKEYPPREITDAYASDKEIMSEKIIVPHLNYRHVLGDRNVATDLVYHSVLWGIDPDDTYSAYTSRAIRFPDLIVYVDTPAELAVARLEARGGDRRNRWDNLVTQRQIRTAFDEVLLRDRYPAFHSVVRIDNSGELPDTYRQVDRLVADRLFGPAAVERPEDERLRATRTRARNRGSPG